MKRWFLLLSLYSFTINSFAEDTQFINEVSIGTGESKDNIGIYRLGVKKNFETTFFESNYGWLSGYYEASLNYWEKEECQIYGIAFSPVFVYYVGSKSNTIHPYIEAGIGLAYISDTIIKGCNMTTNFQFEDRIGMGIRTEFFDLNARYLHYSNARIKQPNDGIDIIIFTMSYIF